jgi:NAD(P)-dependent dehydrogenase (short-subunit alcohol dehydrogenase family)
VASGSGLDDIRALYDFTGRTAVVTGGTGVLGSEMARAIAGCNANVVLLARNPDRAAPVIASLGKAGTGKHLALRADVLDRPALEEAAKAVLGT